MNPLHTRFLQPLDVLLLRGNKLFGDAGSYGEALIPPWPSVAAGALRSRMMADDSTLTAEALQNPEQFALVGFNLARQCRDGGIQTLHRLPADLFPSRSDDSKDSPPDLTPLQPHTTAAGLLSSAPLPMVPVLAQPERSKAVSGYWLTQKGWQSYLNGGIPKADQLVKTDALWINDERVGVGLDPARRQAEDGKLFSVQAIAFKPETGFLVTSRSSTLPDSGLLRFGGDGRAVAVRPAPVPASERPLITPGGRFKMILTTPGLFPNGWLPPGVGTDQRWQGPDGCSAKLVCAAIPRAETVSGWDLAQRQPKAAERAASSGSVYWFDDFQGDPGALEKLSQRGLWDLPGQNAKPQRRAEGFNGVAIGLWS